MYHPTRGGVRGGRDQFSWDDVKVDKHRENYLGHSINAPVGRWQKGKDLHWYTRDKKSGPSNEDALKEEIKRIKEEEEQAMREALGLAPKRSTRPQGNRLDKHEYSELVKRGSTAEDLGGGQAEAAWVHGLGYARAPRPWEDPSTLVSAEIEVTAETGTAPTPPADPPASNNKAVESESEDESKRKKRRREEKKLEKHKRHEKEEKRKKRHSRDSDDRRKHRKDKDRRRHDSDSD